MTLKRKQNKKDTRTTTSERGNLFSYLTPYKNKWLKKAT